MEEETKVKEKKRGISLIAFLLILIILILLAGFGYMFYENRMSNQEIKKYMNTIATSNNATKANTINTKNTINKIANNTNEQSDSLNTTSNNYQESTKYVTNSEKKDIEEKLIEFIGPPLREITDTFTSVKYNHNLIEEDENKFKIAIWTTTNEEHTDGIEKNLNIDRSEYVSGNVILRVDTINKYYKRLFGTITSESDLIKINDVRKIENGILYSSWPGDVPPEINVNDIKFENDIYTINANIKFEDSFNAKIEVLCKKNEDNTYRILSLMFIR